MTAKKSTTAKPKAVAPTPGGRTVIEENVADPFIVEFRGGEHPLPSLATITFGEMEVLSELDLSGGLGQVREIFAAIAPSFAENVLPYLGPSQLAQVVLDWQKAAGVSLPKSEASTTS